MKKVYAVSSGAYSDYGIDAIFSTKEAAQHYINIRKAGDAKSYELNDDIEEYELDPVEDDPHYLHKFGLDLQGNLIYYIIEYAEVKEKKSSDVHLNYDNTKVLVTLCRKGAKRCNKLEKVARDKCFIELERLKTELIHEKERKEAEEKARLARLQLWTYSVVPLLEGGCSLEFLTKDGIAARSFSSYPYFTFDEQSGKMTRVTFMAETQELANIEAEALLRRWAIFTRINTND